MTEIKGSVIRDAIDSLKKRNGDQVYETIINRLDEESRQLFMGTILASSWYPLDSFMKFLEVDIQLTAHGNEQELVTRSEILFDGQLRGIYRAFVRFGSPEFVLNRISIVHKSYFRGVSAQIEMQGSDKARIKYVGFEKQHRLAGPSMIGFFKKALEISGAKDVQVKWSTSIEENKGYCILDISWRGK